MLHTEDTAAVAGGNVGCEEGGEEMVGEAKESAAAAIDAVITHAPSLEGIVTPGERGKE